MFRRLAVPLALLPQALHAQPCSAPPGAGPFERLPHPLRSTATVQVPLRAAAEHVTGCAGIRFRLKPDGTPTDLAILVENPPGYFFGAAVSAAIKATTWPPGLPDGPRYLALTIRPPR